MEGPRVEGLRLRLKKKMIGVLRIRALDQGIWATQISESVWSRGILMGSQL